MKSAQSIPAIFSDVVELAQSEKYYNSYINFIHGHPSEIVAILKAMTQAQETSVKKYPLIALFQDFEEKRGESSDVYASISVTVIIATLTRPELFAADRYEKNFIPILYPVYNAFLKAVRKSGKFKIVVPEKEPEHTKIDRLFWGKQGLYGNEGNIFGDCIDAIELTNLSLKIKNPTCN